MPSHVPAQTWFITGAAAGFGRELTERLLRRGDRVAATARTPERLADLAGEFGDRLWTARLDVTDTVALRSVVDKAFAETGRIDVFVSNAGYGSFGAAEELADESIDRQVRTNLLAPIQLTRAAVPHLRAQGGGRIIQVSTFGGQAAFPGSSLYHATKWGAEGFFQSMVGELGPFGIGVTIVEPGAARTGFGRSLDVASALDAYADGPVGQTRQYIEGSADISADAPGDPGKIADAILASAEVSPAPQRLALGSDTYTIIHAALTDRLAELEAGCELAFSTDVDGPQG